MVGVTSTTEVKESFKIVTMEEAFAKTNINDEYMPSVFI
jgi:hypothetical protein